MAADGKPIICTPFRLHVSSAYLQFMKALLLTLLFTGSASLCMAQSNTPPTIVASKDTLLVEASCGQCRFGMEGKDCDLAVRIDGKAYFVDGTHIDKHGDAHASDGFCNAIRKAKVQGTIVDNRFKATFFQLVPEADKKLKAKKS
jgi:hypothetical protein